MINCIKQVNMLMWVFEWFQRWFQQRGHREYVNPRHKHDLSKALLEHILSYGYAGYACAFCIHDFLSNPRNWIFVSWPFILLFLPMKSSPLKTNTALGTSACYETKIHCQSPAPPRGYWRLNTHQKTWQFHAIPATISLLAEAIEAISV